MDSTNSHFNCQACNKQFSTSFSLKRHQKNVHQDKNVQFSARNQQKCPICAHQVGTTSKELQTHLTNTHKIELKKKSLTFKSNEDFQTWKKSEEKETNSMYVKHWSGWTSKTFTSTTYYCHRSGNFRTRSSGKRQPKSLGTNKINSLCPSQIKCKNYNDGHVQVEYVKTHAGHAPEIRRMQLTESEKRAIAEKLAKSVPLHTILDEIRGSVCGNLQRIHLVNRRDLLNIANKFGLNHGGMQNTRNAASLDAWVRKVSGEDSPVVFYKPRNTVLNSCRLLKTDFVLIVMNRVQKDHLLSFGHNLTCIDTSLHGKSGTDLSLTTVLVLDDNNEGFPVVFALSNNRDQATMEFIFNKIKETGIELEVNALMTGLGDACVDVWTGVFGAPKSRLFCEWSVDQDWLENLRRVASIGSQAELYKILTCLMNETDQIEFESKLDEAIDFFAGDPGTVAFGDYFVENYSNNCAKWARCFRGGFDGLEESHEVVRSNYLQGKRAKQLGESIHALMKFVVEKKFDRIIGLSRAKIVTGLRDRHLQSLELDLEDVVVAGTCWMVKSRSETGVMYSVEKWRACVESCPAMCEGCNCCIHRFRCTCIDNCIKSNMCKHIHLVCRQIAKLEECEDEQEKEEEEESELVVAMDYEQEEVEVLIPRSQEVQCLLSDFNRQVLECESVEDQQFVMTVIKEAMVKLETGKKCR